MLIGCQKNIISIFINKKKTQKNKLLDVDICRTKLNTKYCHR